jgi:hypothetical protein
MNQCDNVYIKSINNKTQVIFLKILFKMSDFLYMLNARIEIISFDTQSS